MTDIYYLYRPPFTFDSLINLPQLPSELINLQYMSYYFPPISGTLMVCFNASLKKSSLCAT